MPRKELPQYQILISTVDTVVGQALVEELRNNHINDKNPHNILGTKSARKEGPIPSAVNKIIDPANTEEFTKALLESDVIVYDMMKAPLDEIEYAVKVMRMADFEKDKIFILLSSVLVWGQTPQKEKQVDDTGRDTEEDDILAYTELEYSKRRPPPKYEGLKAVESQCLSIGNYKNNLYSYVLCSGVPYGHGESSFSHFFKEAWNQQELSMVGDGSNFIPTIHVQDLAQFAHFIVEKKPFRKYILAIDHAPKPTLQSHLEAISNNLGIGRTRQVNALEAMDHPCLELFQTNIRLKRSTIVEEVENHEKYNREEIQEEDEDESLEESLTLSTKFRFKWQYKGGFSENIHAIIDEYNAYRGLRTLKVCLCGPPAAGKTYFAEKLSQTYQLPHIHVKGLIEEITKLDDEFGEEIRTFLENEKQRVLEENIALAEELKKKKKKNVVEPETDPDKIVPKLTEELLHKCFRWRLSQNDAYNKGYILDGFPRHYENAKGIFMDPVPQTEQSMDKKEEAEPEEKKQQAPPPTSKGGKTPKTKEKESATNTKETEQSAVKQIQYVLDPKRLPEFVINIEGSDDFLKNRIKEILTPEQIEGTHYSEDGMTRRLATYRKNNPQEVENVKNLMTFFKENGLEPLNINLDEPEELEQLESKIIEHLESKGSLQGLMAVEDGGDLASRKQRVIDNERVSQIEDTDRKEQEEKIATARRLEKEAEAKKMEKLKQREKKLLDERSQKLRQYLADMVVPLLTSAMIDVCRVKPEDPLDHLIEYLERRSPEVRFPNQAQLELKPPEKTVEVQENLAVSQEDIDEEGN